MKITAKTLFSGFAALLFSASAFALETGGVLSNDAKFSGNKTSDLDFDNVVNASAWLRTALSDDGSSYFIMEGSFKNEYDDSVADSDEKMSNTLDVTLFKLALHRELASGDVTFVTGRFFNSDASGLVFSQNADGLKIDYDAYSFKIAFFGAYTGLLNAKNTTILDYDQPELDNDKLYVVANKYAVAGLTFVLPHIVANQTVALEGFGTFSLEDTKYNRLYGTLSLSGPLVSPLFYDLSSTLGFSSYDGADFKVANLTKGSLSLYPDFKSMSVSLNAVYASGSQGPFEKFQGFTSMTAVNSLNEPEYSGIVTTGLSASIKPLEQLLLRASGDIVFDAAEEIEQAGFQYAVGFDWQIVSDVALGASFGQYIGKDNSDADKTVLKCNIRIAF